MNAPSLFCFQTVLSFLIAFDTIGENSEVNWMKKNKETVFKYIQDNSGDFVTGFTTKELAERLSFQRSNMSSILNELVSEKRLSKSSSRPVIYKIVNDGLTAGQESTFDLLIGSGNGSLKNNIDLAKASLMYPKKSLSTLLVGAPGTGKAFFAQTMYSFACETGLLSDRSVLITIDGKTDSSNSEFVKIFDGNIRTLQNAGTDGGMLVIHNFEFLASDIRNQIIQIAKLPEKRFYLVCSISDSLSGVMRDILWESFPVKLEFSRLEHRSFKERFDYIHYFFHQESRRMNRGLIISSEVLRCLLLYNCPNQLDQLRQDIQMACANAFMRDIHRKTGKISVYLGDFQVEVRKGFLMYSRFREEIEDIIPSTYTYVFSEKDGLSIRENELDPGVNIYQTIEKRKQELGRQGLTDSEISIVISESIERQLTHFTNEQDKNLYDRTALEKIVGPWIVSEVEEFVTKSSEKLGRVFSASIIQALSLHLQAAISFKKSHPLSGEKVEKIRNEYPDEYELVLGLLNHIKQETEFDLGESEAGLLTYFLTHSTSDSEKVAVLIAMHGSGTAHSIAQVVRNLLSYSHLHAYDMQLDKDMVTVYEELKSTVQQLDRGKGILVIYDMGSIQTILETVAKETGIQIRFIQVPITLLALEAARRIDDDLSLEELHKSLLESMSETLHITQNIHSREVKPKAVITLCMSGEGAALIMKDYIEQRSHLQNTQVIALALSDKKRLLATLKRLKTRFEIVCIVGTYNPNIFGIPFASITTLYNTPVEQLEVAMYLEKNDELSSFNYDEIYKYLKEHQANLNITSLKRLLPSTVRKIKNISDGLKLDQEVGLFVHLASLVSRLQQEGTTPDNPVKDRIITSHKRLFYELTEIVTPLEEEFGIEIPEDEIANIISIIKEI